MKENYFDNIKPNLRELYKKQELEIENLKKININKIFFIGYFRIIRDAIFYKTGVLESLCYSGFINDWFLPFKKYWSQIYGGRNINLDDFFNLKFHFRKIAQSTEQLSWDSPENHILNWQDPINVSQLFHYAYKGCLLPFQGFKFLRKTKSNIKILEYGCSIAPYYSTYRKYLSHKKQHWTLMDIPNHAFHFARYKYQKDNSVVQMPVLYPDFFDNPFNLIKTKKFDIIIITTVFEHLDEPLIVAKELHKHLNKGGVLLFDYILSDAEGLDTVKGLEKREETLKFLFENFIINKDILEYLDSTLPMISAVKK